MTHPSKKTSRAAARRQEVSTAWLLVHVEYMGCTAHPYRDRMPMHVSTTRRAALSRARKLYTSPAGWWELYCFGIDEPQVPVDEDSAQRPQAYLDYRGRVVRAPQIARAEQSFRRARAREIAAGLFPDGEHQCALCSASVRASQPRRKLRRSS